MTNYIKSILLPMQEQRYAALNNIHKSVDIERVLTNKEQKLHKVCEMSGSHGDEHEVDSFLGYSDV
jgi:hypothetical protein